MESGGTEIPCGGVSKTPLGAKQQGDFAKVEDGQKRFDEAVQSWEMTLPKMKALMEK